MDSNTGAETFITFLNRNRYFAESHYTVDDIKRHFQRISVRKSFMKQLLHKPIELARIITAEMVFADLDGHYHMYGREFHSSLRADENGTSLPQYDEDSYLFNHLKTNERDYTYHDCFSILKNDEIDQCVESVLAILKWVTKVHIINYDDGYSVEYLNEFIRVKDNRIIDNRTSLRPITVTRWTLTNIETVGTLGEDDNKNHLMITTTENRSPEFISEVVDALKSIYDGYTIFMDEDAPYALKRYYKDLSEHKKPMLMKLGRKIEYLYDREKDNHDFDNNMIWGSIESVFYDTNALSKGAESFAYPDGDIHYYDDYDSEGYHIHKDGTKSSCFSYGAALVDTAYAAYSLKEHLIQKYDVSEMDLYESLEYVR